MANSRLSVPLTRVVLIAPAVVSNPVKLRMPNVTVWRPFSEADLDHGYRLHPSLATRWPPTPAAFGRRKLAIKCGRRDLKRLERLEHSRGRS